MEEIDFQKNPPKKMGAWIEYYASVKDNEEIKIKVSYAATQNLTRRGSASHDYRP